jgi:hypothetical protein
LYLRHLVTPVLAAVLLAACQSGQQDHTEVSKAGVNLDEASADLAACHYDVEKAPRPMPFVAPIVTGAPWVNHRDQLAIRCLESKGYKVISRPGSCLGTCIGSVSFTTSN